MTLHSHWVKKCSIVNFLFVDMFVFVYIKSPSECLSVEPCRFILFFVLWLIADVAAASKTCWQSGHAPGNAISIDCDGTIVWPVMASPLADGAKHRVIAIYNSRVSRHNFTLFVPIENEKDAV